MPPSTTVSPDGDTLAPPDRARADWARAAPRPRRSPAVGRRVLTALVVPAAILALWWFVTSRSFVAPYLLPSPGAVWRAGWQEVASGDLLRSAAASLERVGFGVGVGGVLGLAVGALVGWSRRAAALLEPTLDLLRHIPPLAWVPFALLWFKGGLLSAAFIVLLVSFFPVFIGTAHALRSVPVRLLDMARTTGASRRRTLVSVALPAALPQIVASLRVALGGGWMAVVAAEYFGYRHGLGALAFNAYQVLRADLVVVAMIAIGLLGLLIDLVVRLFADRLVWWGGR
ncbi:ABC transporter permease [Carbonactinospora thermoautotrophica]|uniref:ABC transporter permease n=1 Tax=Carbonactinospora thermoautotrophica TaxID=1469144 RepID=UPI00226E5E1D|nr:ABC transporter permease [Carbonactinospora thermoautotrophica]